MSRVYKLAALAALVALTSCSHAGSAEKARRSPDLSTAARATQSARALRYSARQSSAPAASHLGRATTTWDWKETLVRVPRRAEALITTTTRSARSTVTRLVAVGPRWAVRTDTGLWTCGLGGVNAAFNPPPLVQLAQQAAFVDGTVPLRRPATGRGSAWRAKLTLGPRRGSVERFTFVLAPRSFIFRKVTYTASVEGSSETGHAVIAVPSHTPRVALPGACRHS